MAVSAVRYESKTQLIGSWLWLARAVWLVALVAAVGVYVLNLEWRFLSLHTLVTVGRTAVYQLGLNADFYAWYHITFEVGYAIATVFMGLLIFWRRSDDWVAMMVSMTLIMYGTRVDGFPADAQRLFNRDWRLVLDGMMAFQIGLSLIIFYVFPDGRFVPRWTKWLGAIWLLWVTSWVMFPNSPVNMLRWNQLIDQAWRAYIAQVLWYGTGALAQLQRYQKVASPIERQQTKWAVFGLVFPVVSYMALNLPYAALPALQQLGTPRVIYGLLHKPLIIGGLLAMPVSFAVATLRYRLWDIGIVVNRTLVYTAVTSMLIVLYFGSVLGLQEVLRPFTVDASPLAVAASTLVIAAVANPLRVRTQHFIDRRFYRERYDAAATLTEFAAVLRDEVDLTRLSECLEDVITSTVQPAHTLCWLRTPTGYNIHLFNAEDLRPGEPASAWAQGEIALDDPIVEYLREKTDIVELDLVDLQSAAFDRLRRSGTVLIVPLVSQGELIGWLTLGPRLSDQGYSTQDSRMLTALASQAAPAFRVAQLVVEQKSAALERERLQQELKVARLIQQTLLPQEPPALPGWELAGFYQPAQAVGGDFYDFLTFEDGRLGIVVADVTDKGIPAALVMATTRSLLRSVAFDVISPGWVLRRVNRLLHPDIPPAMFVTCWYAVLDPVTGLLQYANAGHNLPFRSGNGQVSELRAVGMPLGLMPGMEYEEHETVLEPDERVLFYSDGLVEAHNPWREMFGGKRVRRLLQSHSGDGQSLIQCLVGELRTFTTPGSEQEDDVTLVTLQRVGGAS